MSIDELLDWFDANHVELARASCVVVVRHRPGCRRSTTSALGVARAVDARKSADWSLVPALRRLVGPHLTIRAGYAAGEVGGIAHLDIGPDDPIGRGRIPLGRPEPGVEVRLEPLDDDATSTQLLVARPRTFGYLGDPELTASRYITDEEGTRWWRSRDLVRVDDAGMYHHMGRADEMMKVKGAFVAPSRVDAVLQSIDGIGGSATMLHRTANDSVRIVAHVQVIDDTLTPERVEAQLRERLPPDLVPAILMRHDELPRTQRMKTRPPGSRERAARALAVVAAAAAQDRVRVVVSRRSAPHHRARGPGPRRRPLRSRTGLPRCARARRGARRRRLR